MSRILVESQCLRTLMQPSYALARFRDKALRDSWRSKAAVCLLYYIILRMQLLALLRGPPSDATLSWERDTGCGAAQQLWCKRLGCAELLG